jgi:hypothetical protein
VAEQIIDEGETKKGETLSPLFFMLSQFISLLSMREPSVLPEPLQLELLMLLSFLLQLEQLAFL